MRPWEVCGWRTGTEWASGAFAAPDSILSVSAYAAVKIQLNYISFYWHLIKTSPIVYRHRRGSQRGRLSQSWKGGENMQVEWHNGRVTFEGRFSFVVKYTFFLIILKGLKFIVKTFLQTGVCSLTSVGAELWINACIVKLSRNCPHSYLPWAVIWNTLW